jgi:putative transposase
MNRSMPEFRRKPNRLGDECYLGRRAYFLTLCTAERRELLTRAEFVGGLVSLLRSTCTSQGFNGYAYCFMPDHLHLVATGQSDSASLPRFLQAFKSLGARESWKHSIEHLWQKGFYDHVLRDGDSLDAAAWYALLNPVRAGLVRRAEEWPYSGSFVFAWPGLRAVSQVFIPPWKSGKEK